MIRPVNYAVFKLIRRRRSFIQHSWRFRNDMSDWVLWPGGSIESTVQRGRIVSHFPRVRHLLISKPNHRKDRWSSAIGTAMNWPRSAFADTPGIWHSRATPKTGLSWRRPSRSWGLKLPAVQAPEGGRGPWCRCFGRLEKRIFMSVLPWMAPPGHDTSPSRGFTCLLRKPSCPSINAWPDATVDGTSPAHGIKLTCPSPSPGFIFTSTSFPRFLATTGIIFWG